MFKQRKCFIIINSIKFRLAVGSGRVETFMTLFVFKVLLIELYSFLKFYL